MNLTEAETPVTRQPDRATSLPLRIFLAVSGASVGGAILWQIMRWPPGNFGHVAGAAMIGSAAACAVAPLVRATGWGRAWVAAIGAAIIGGGAEVAGLFLPIFGPYAYTPAWQPVVELPRGQLYPVWLPVTWFVILAACYAFVRQRANGWMAVGLAALLATLADLVAEPVLTGPVGFWIWLEPGPLLGVPVSNAVGWFLTALAGCAWIATILQGRQPHGTEPFWMLASALAGTAVVGATHGEPRGFWALVLLPGLVAWQALGTRRTAAR